MYKERCLICNNENLKKFYLCEECSSLINDDVNFGKTLKYVDEIIVGMDYVGLGREIILDYKFKEKTYFVKYLSELLISKMLEEGLHKRYNYISYVPMYKLDLKNRGFNQSAMLAKEISNNLKIELISPVKKVNKTKEQVQCESEKDRILNIKGAFEYTGEFVENVILVDDVITTGSTIDEVARMYKENGTKKVAAVIAATQSF